MNQIRRSISISERPAIENGITGYEMNVGDFELKNGSRKLFPSVRFISRNIK